MNRLFQIQVYGYPFKQKNVLKSYHLSYLNTKFPYIRLISTKSSQSNATTIEAEITTSNPSKILTKSQFQLYSELSKSKLSALVVMTTGAGFLMAGGPISWTSLGAATIGTSLAACSANTFNQVWEKNRDKLMQRTFQRPLPSGRLSVSQALTWGITTGIASTGILAIGCNPITAALGASNILLYSLVYTPMKTRTEFNTHIGSIVGAIPPIMGWAAATGHICTMESALIGSLLYLWQFPHFYALSWRLRKDYARGGFKMLPCADPTGVRTANATMRYSAMLAPLPIIASMSGITSSMFAVEGTLINGYLLYLSSKFQSKPNTSNAKKVFMCSLWYLPALLGCMVFHSHNWLSTEKETKELEKKREWMPPTNEWTMSLNQRIMELRQQLREICVHEMMWGYQENKKTTTDASAFCPVTIKDQTRSNTETQSKNHKTSTIN